MRQVDIKEFEDYQVTDDGRVWSKKRNRWLKPSLTNEYYNHIILCKNGIKYGKVIYRLVAEAFIPNPDNKPCVDHIIPVSEGGTDDVSNLRWCTYKENNNNPITRQKMSIGSTGKKHTEETKQKMSLQRRGENNPRWGKKYKNNGK